MFGGATIIVSENALKDSDVRNFPVSRHRSARLHKKLVKRYGGEFRKVGCIYRIGDQMIMHPTIYADFQQQMAQRLRQSTENLFIKAYSNITENSNVI